MDKYIYDEKNRLWGELFQVLPYHPKRKNDRDLGQWHKRDLHDHRKAIYTILLTSGKRNSYLATIDEQAKRITEQRKVKSGLEWVQRMNKLNGTRE